MPEGFDYLEIHDKMEEALDVVFNSNRSLLLLGNAGTGKSELVDVIKAKGEEHANTVVLAPTGVAATRVGGQTIHSFFKLAPELYQFGRAFNKKLDNPLIEEVCEVLRGTKRIIIDEISMVRADMIDAINEHLQHYTGNHDFFGGKQMIFVGDIFQLPPVLKNNKDSAEVEYFNRHYNGNPHFFGGKAFTESCMLADKFKFIEFTKIFRQEEGEFTEVLNRIRKGTHSIGKDLSYINSQITNQKVISEKYPNYVYMATTNKVVDKINSEFLEKNPNRLETFSAKIEKNANPKNFLAPEFLDLKKDSKVMFLANSPTGAYKNGTIGFYKGSDYNDDDEQYLIIEVLDKKHGAYNVFINPYKWDDVKYVKDPDTQEGKELRVSKKVLGSFTQFPIKLAYAVTVHKSQSATYESAYVDMGHYAFAPHMVYVALSRLKSIDGLGIKTPIRNNHIKMDKRVQDFYAIKFLEKVEATAS